MCPANAPPSSSPAPGRPHGPPSPLGPGLQGAFPGWTELSPSSCGHASQQASPWVRNVSSLLPPAELTFPIRSSAATSHHPPWPPDPTHTFTEPLVTEHHSISCSECQFAHLPGVLTNELQGKGSLMRPIYGSNSQVNKTVI